MSFPASGRAMSASSLSISGDHDSVEEKLKLFCLQVQQLYSKSRIGLDAPVISAPIGQGDLLQDKSNRP